MKFFLHILGLVLFVPFVLSWTNENGVCVIKPYIDSNGNNANSDYMIAHKHLCYNCNEKLAFDKSIEVRINFASIFEPFFRSEE